MAEPELSPEIRKALDSYTVPPLPTGFSDRLVSRIEAIDTSSEVLATGFAHRFRRNGAGGSGWYRSSRIISSIAFLSLATATAAAAGFFGNPVYVPGVSEVLAKAELVPTPRYAWPVKPEALVVEAIDAAVEATPTVPANGTEAVVSRIQQLRKDPNFDNLAPRHKFVLARKEVGTMVRSGDATLQEARSAVRQLMRSADPETKTQWRGTAKARREAMLEKRERYRDAPPEQRAAIRQALRERQQNRQQHISADTEARLQP